MGEKSLAELVTAANAHLNDAARNRVIGSSGDRFELYHFALSLCSHKVRTVLAEKNIGYHSHDIGILPPQMENYQPDYVRLRLRGGHGKRMVDGYTGRSSTTTEGFDPCVVPTLVDHQTDRVLVDSKAICEYLNQQTSGIDLMPARLDKEIERQVTIVDNTPHVAVLYGAHPDHDVRPEMLRHNMPGVHDYKIMRLMESRSLAIGNPTLTTAYDQKIRKEAAAKTYVRDETMMRAAIEEIDGIIEGLENDLNDQQQWLCSDDFTLADVMWAVSLFRLKWLGMGYLWENGNRVRVENYAKRLFKRPSFQTAVIHWPGNPPSEYVMEYYAKPEEIAEPKRSVGSTADIKEENLTAAIRATLANTRNPRTKKIFDALIRHLHEFIEEVELTEQEWEKAISFLTRTGQLCDGDRQEYVLLSDVLGATARVDLINHRFPAGATEHSVLGPFFVENRPTFENGADISNGIKGKPLFVSARVMNTEHKPIASARVDIWHSDDAGHYDVLMPNQKEAALRGLFRTDADGRFWFNSILPASYPIPMDGTVGELMQAAGRSPVRPAHLHVRIEAPGYARLTTMLFVAGDEHLDSDPVFGVKTSLIVPFKKTKGGRTPDGAALPKDCHEVNHDFVLAKKR